MSPPSWISLPPPTLSHPSRLLQSPSLSSLSRRANSHWQCIYISSVAQLCPTLCDPMACSTPGLPVHHQLLELAQTYVHQIGDAIQLEFYRPSTNCRRNHSFISCVWFPYFFKKRNWICTFLIIKVVCAQPNRLRKSRSIFLKRWALPIILPLRGGNC